MLPVGKRTHDRVAELNDVCDALETRGKREVQVVILLKEELHVTESPARNRAAAVIRTVELAVRERRAEKLLEDLYEEMVPGSRDRGTDKMNPTHQIKI